MIGNLISAGADIIGGLFGARNADKQMDQQREFAKNGIRWRVKDAEAAGIHPLAALGAQTASYSPVSVGDVSTSFSNAGQDIARAIDSKRTHSERDAAVLKSAQDLQLQRLGLENQLLEAQIARVRSAGSPPAMPSAATNYLIPGQGETAAGIVNDKPMERINPAPGALHQEPGAVSDQGFSRTATGIAPVYSKDVKERLEDDFLGMLAWNLRNRILPTFGMNRNPPPDSALPEGHDSWGFDPFRQEYYPRRSGKRGYTTGGGF